MKRLLFLSSLLFCMALSAQEWIPSECIEAIRERYDGRSKPVGTKISLAEGETAEFGL